MPKRVVVIVAIAAIIVSGLILLLAKQSTTLPQPTAIQSPTSSSASSSIARLTPTENQAASSTVDTLTWKTYRNEKYGFQFQYPPDWKFVVTDKAFDLYGPHDVPGRVIPTMHLVIAENVERISINDWIEKNKVELEIPQTEEGVLKYAVVLFGTKSAISFHPVLGGTDDTVYLLDRSTNVFQFYFYLQEAPGVVKDEISALISSISFGK